jgi:serine/arginine repetitive matrix protein 2
MLLSSLSRPCIFFYFVGRRDDIFPMPEFLSRFLVVAIIIPSCDVALDTDLLLSSHTTSPCCGSLQLGMERPSAAEQRATAVAKLKRAASLPRMQNGRRPPMHADAVSEGEKGGADISSSNPTPSPPEISIVASPVQQSDPPASLPVAPGPMVHEPSASPSVAPQSEEEQHSRQSNTEPPSTVTSPEKNTRAKRRSRSRSRSRASKDLKAKARAAQTPTPLNGNDSSPEEASDANAPASPPLISPIPSRLIPPQQRSPIFLPPSLTPEPYGFFQSSPSPLPTLEAIAANTTLMRSNSAAARMMAMAKLTGEPLDPSMLPLPSPSPKLGRNNTVAGGERVAARRNMLRMIAERTKDVATESASEDAQAPSPKPKRRRRSRSKRASAGTSQAVEESDYIPISAPDTPLRPPSTLPPTPAPIDQLHPSLMSRLDDSLSRTSSPLANQTKQGLQLAPEHAQPRKRRSVLVEEEDPEEQPPATSVMQSSTYLVHRAALVSEVSQDQSSVFESSYVSPTQRAPSGDQFPSNPFGTPLQERPSRDDEEEEKVIYQPEVRSRAQTPFQDAYGREISWVAEPRALNPTCPNDQLNSDEL